MDVKVSIIIPVYNVAPYLDACLSSCVNQTFRDIEIIVVNDGSPDTSYQIIEKYAAMDERIVVIIKENEGLIFARKSGLDIARGEYIFHLDGDDYIESNAIEVLYKEALDKDSDYVMANSYYVSRESKRSFLIRQEIIGLSGQDLLTFLIDNIWWDIWGRLIRKDLFDGIVYRNVFMGEDLYLNMQIALNVKKAAVVENCLYHYVQHGGSIMAQSIEVTLNSYVKEIESVWSLWDIYPYEQHIKERLSDWFRGFLIYAISKNKSEIRSVLEKCYWNRKEIKAYLWKKRTSLYFLYGGYLYAPRITCLGVRLGLGIKYLLRCLSLKNKSNC